MSSNISPVTDEGSSGAEAGCSWSFKLAHGWARIYAPEFLRAFQIERFTLFPAKEAKEMLYAMFSANYVQLTVRVGEHSQISLWLHDFA